MHQTGQTYDRDSLLKWLKEHPTCPLTGERCFESGRRELFFMLLSIPHILYAGERLSNIQLVPNYHVKSALADYLSSAPSSPVLSSSQSASPIYPRLANSALYPNLADDGQPGDKLAQVHVVLAHIRVDSLDFLLRLGGKSNHCLMHPGTQHGAGCL